MADIIKTGFRLFIIAAISALLLGVTHKVTQDVIIKREREMAVEIKQVVVAGADEFNALDMDEDHIEDEDAMILEVDMALSKGEEVGYVFKVKSMGYDDYIEFLVGLDLEGQILAIDIGRHTETAGLGSNIEEDYFLDQFVGKTSDLPLSVTRGDAGDQEIESLGGATRSSRAMVNGINIVTEYYREVIDKDQASLEALKNICISQYYKLLSEEEDASR